MNRLTILAWLLSTAFSLKPVYATTWTCSQYRVLPVLLDKCAGEGCPILRYDRAVDAADLFDAPNVTSKKSDSLKKCERIVDFKPYIFLKSLGSVEVLRVGNKAKAIGLKIHDIVPVSVSRGEGYLLGCIGNKDIDLVTGDAAQDGETAVRIVMPSQEETWIRIKTPRGKIGYTQDRSFYMGYYTYDSERLCPKK